MPEIPLFFNKNASKFLFFSFVFSLHANSPQKRPKSSKKAQCGHKMLEGAEPAIIIYCACDQAMLSDAKKSATAHATALNRIRAVLAALPLFVTIQ